MTSLRFLRPTVIARQQGQNSVGLASNFVVSLRGNQQAPAAPTSTPSVSFHDSWTALDFACTALHQQTVGLLPKTHRPKAHQAAAAPVLPLAFTMHATTTRSGRHRSAWTSLGQALLGVDIARHPVAAACHRAVDVPGRPATTPTPSRPRHRRGVMGSESSLLAAPTSERTSLPFAKVGGVV